MRKFFFYTVILIFSSYFLINTLRILYHLYNVENSIANSRTELKEIQKENTDLKKQLSEVQSPYFLEKEARDKLLLKGPNEEVFVAPQIKKSAEKPEENLPNWKKWEKLILE